MTSKTETLASEAYQKLRADIISSNLAPGNKLRIEALKDRYSIGASPLREALSQLTAEGFVTANGRCGFAVPPLSESNLQDIMSARAVMEVQCLKLSIQNGDEVWESALVASHYQLDKIEANLDQRPDALFEDWEIRHNAFHSALVAACPSRWLLTFREILYAQHLRYRHNSLNHRYVTPGLAQEHRDILQMALERKVEQAAQAMEHHILQTIDTNIRALRESSVGLNNH